MTVTPKRGLFFGLWCCLAGACQAPESVRLPAEAALPTRWMDTTVRAQDDFYSFAAGSWLKNPGVPVGEARWGIRDSYRAAHEQRLFYMLLRASKGSPFPEGTDNRKMVEFFRVAVDSLGREQRGTAPLLADWDKINRIASEEDMQKYLAERHRYSEGVFFSLRPSAGESQTGPMVLMEEPTLTLPAAALYLSYDEEARALRADYKAHISSQLQRAGVSIAQSQKEAEQVMAVEVFLARAMEKRSEAGDTRAVTELDALYPFLKWPSFLRDAGIVTDSVLVGDPSYMKECARMFLQFDLSEQKAYLRWKALASAAPFLTKAMAESDHTFRQRWISKPAALPPRWKVALYETNRAFGDVVARMYLKDEVDPEMVTRAGEVTDNCRMAFASLLKDLPWMSDSTKKKSLQRLKEMRVHLGQPRKWRNYAGLVLEKDAAQRSLFSFTRNARAFQEQQKWATTSQKPDSAHWPVSPLDIRVAYDVETNQLFVPAALLQSPYFDVSASGALAYAWLGTMVSHELVEGLISRSLIFEDRDDVTAEWNDTEQRYVTAQAFRFRQSWQKQVVPVRVNRVAQIDTDDVSSMGALAIAFEAYQRSLRERGRPESTGRFTPEQLFLIASNQVLAEVPVSNAENSVSQKVNALLSHFAPFYEAFQVQPADKMYLKEQDRAVLWSEEKVRN